MKALFIGGTGTISTDVVALAQQRGWEITLLNRGSKKLPEGMRSIVADIHDEQAVAKAIAHESYDVVAQFIGYTAKDVERDIIIRKSKFPQNPKRSVRFSGKRTKRSVQKRKARNTQKAETKVL